jgi:hypothetical protein
MGGLGLLYAAVAGGGFFYEKGKMKMGIGARDMRFE